MKNNPLCVEIYKILKEYAVKKANVFFLCHSKSKQSPRIHHFDTIIHKEKILDLMYKLNCL